ncbi:Uncharacterised protein [Enterobacter cancerogenus]|nr:Uncharacterised protein [Enterobacter cancerogenus]VFS15005.1 Uncharacterised protein [Enterobacter cancerogenus]
MNTLAESSQVLGNAIQRLDKKTLDKSTKKAIRDLLAYTSSKSKIKTSRFKKELKDKFIKMKASIDWNIENKGEKLRFKNRMGRDMAIAYVYPNDPEKKNIIYLTEVFVKEKAHFSAQRENALDNVETIIHEVSHFQMTEDYFYAPQPHTTSADEYFNVTLKGLHDFNRIVGTDSDPNIMELQTKYSLLGAIDPVNKARKEFYEGRSRLKIALNNADHMALLAMQLGHPSRIPA